MTKEEKMIKTEIPYDKYDLKGSMNLENCYSLTVAELGLQQSKRDQIIAFYLTILGFVIPSVISLSIADGAKAVAFFAMYMIGTMFCHVILRYRIYKEVYWIACRVLTQMYNIKEEMRDKEVIYTLFYGALKNNMSSIVHFKDEERKKKSLWKSFKRQLNSAETLLFETLVLFSMFVGFIGALYLWSVSKVVAVLVVIFLIGMVICLNYKYATRLMVLYDCVLTGKEKDLEKTFSKAWMLHCFVDDIMEKEAVVQEEEAKVEK